MCWLHGFTQTGRSAHRFRSILAGGRDVLTPDLARHGVLWDTGGSLDEIAQLVLKDLPDEPVDLGGYSFGARIALHLAIAEPRRIRRLVLLSGTRGIREPEARRARVGRDEALAQHIETVGAEPFLAEWLSQPMFAALPNDAEERSARSDQHANALASSLREAGTGTQRWLGEQVATLNVPTLSLAGAHDPRFAKEALEIARQAPRSSFALVPGAGHAAHLHQPVWSAQLVANFLDESGHDDAGDDETESEQ